MGLSGAVAALAAALLGAALAHKLPPGRSHPVLLATPWRRRHATALAAVALAVEAGLIAALATVPAAGLAGTALLMLVYAGALRAMAPDAGCGCLPGPLEVRVGTATARNVVFAAVAAAAAIDGPAAGFRPAVAACAVVAGAATLAMRRRRGPAPVAAAPEPAAATEIHDVRELLEPREQEAAEELLERHGELQVVVVRGGCAACRRLAAPAGGEAAWIAVAVDPGRAQLRRLRAAHALVSVDAGGVRTRRAGVTSFPFYLRTDADGRIVARRPGRSPLEAPATAVAAG